MIHAMNRMILDIVGTVNIGPCVEANIYNSTLCLTNDLAVVGIHSLLRCLFSIWNNALCENDHF